MNISGVPGCKLIHSFKNDFNLSKYPIMILCLFPNIGQKEMFNLINGYYRWIDRSTGPFVLVVLFWKSFKKKEIETFDNGFWKKHMKEKILKGNFSEKDMECIRNGFIDESISIANELGLSISKLPCLIIFDNPHSDIFYKVPYHSVRKLLDFLARLVDFLKKEYPQYCQRIWELTKISNQINTYKIQGISKRLKRKIIEKACKSQKVLEKYNDLEHEIFQKERNGSIFHRRKDNFSLNTILRHPNDLDRLESISKNLSLIGIDPNRAHYFRQLIIIEAEKTLSIDNLSNILNLKEQIKAEIKNLDRPCIKNWIKKNTLADVISSASNSVPIFKTVLDITEKLSKIF